MFNYYPTKPVNPNWQIFFVVLGLFMIPTDIYAFLRIQKLRRYLLIVFLPHAVIVFTLVLVNPVDIECESEWFWIIYDTCLSLESQVLDNIVVAIFTVFAIYLVRKWSIEWNKNK